MSNVERLHKVDARTCAAIVRRAGVCLTDPITDIYDALVDWALENGYNEDEAHGFAEDHVSEVAQ